jgi:hypothetical protein
MKPFVELALPDFDADRRQFLGQLLRAGNLPHEWTDRGVDVPESRAAQAEAVVALVREGSMPAPVSMPAPAEVEERIGLAVQPRVDRLGRTIASPGRRAMGWWIDGLVLTALQMVLRDTLNAVVVWGAMVVIGTALWGRTPGKLAVAMRVVPSLSRRPPGFVRSVVRWAVPESLVVVAVVTSSTAVMVAAAAVQAATFLPVLWDSQRRGLNDRAAGTLVIVTR